VGRLKNVSGEAREVPLLGNRVVEPDEVVDVDDELLDPEQYVWPASTWQVVEPPATEDRTVEQLQAELRERGLPVSGTKAELVERLATADSETAGEVA